MKLVDNAKHAYKWLSVQAMALVLAIVGAWMAMPPDLKSRIPETWVDALSMAVLVLGMFGRVVDQGSSK
jgi:membrane protein required for beta-lactamase induction